MELINSILKLEFSTNNDSGNFTTCRVNISNKLHLYLNSPMTLYNADTTDLFLFVLGNVFDINIFILKLNERECWVEDLMKNHGCDRETIHFVKTMSQHIDLVAPIPTQDTLLHDSVEITSVLPETEGDGKVQQVKPHRSDIDSRNADKDYDFGIKCKLFSCIFSQVQNYLFEIHFYREFWQKSTLVLRDTDQNFGSYMIDNCFKICQKFYDRFFNKYNIIFCFKRIWFS